MPTIPYFFAYSGVSPSNPIGSTPLSNIGGPARQLIGENLPTEPLPTTPFVGSFCGTLASPNFTPNQITGGTRVTPTTGYSMAGAFSDLGLIFAATATVGSVTYPAGPRPDLIPLSVVASGYIWIGASAAPSSLFSIATTIVNPTTGHVTFKWSHQVQVIDGTILDTPFISCEARLNGASLPITVVVTGGTFGAGTSYSDPAGGTHTWATATYSCTADADVPLNTPYLDVRLTSASEVMTWQRLKINPVAAFVDGGNVVDASTSYAFGDTISDYQVIYTDPFTGSPAPTIHSAIPQVPFDINADATTSVALTVTNTQGCSNFTSGSVVAVGPRTLIHEQESGLFFYGYIANGALRCAKSRNAASYTTSGDVQVDDGSSPATWNHAAFHHNGYLCYVFTVGRTVFLRESKDSGATWGARVTIASNSILLGVAFEQDSGILYCLVRDSSGNTFYAKASLNQQAGTWTPVSPVAVSGLGTGLTATPVIYENGQYTAIVKSGINLNLFNSTDGVNYS